MAVLKGLLEVGKLTPVVDNTYPLSEVSAAIRYLEEGHAQGKGVIRCEGNPKEDSCSHSVGEDATGDHRSGSRGCVPGDALPGGTLWQPARGQADPTDRTGEPWGITGPIPADIASCSASHHPAATGDGLRPGDPKVGERPVGVVEGAKHSSGYYQVG